MPVTFTLEKSWEDGVHFIFVFPSEISEVEAQEALDEVDRRMWGNLEETDRNTCTTQTVVRYKLRQL